MAISCSAQEAVNKLGALIEANAHESSKYNFVICDTTEAWILSSFAQNWAAQQLKNGFKPISCQGLAVTDTIDKSREGLEDILKNLGHWNGEVF